MATANQHIIKMIEIWKDIAGYEGFYQVSNLGNVKSLFRIIETGNNKRSVSERMLTKTKNRDGYIKYSLSKNGILKNYQIHRLVAIAFIPNPLKKPQVNHINGIKSDNYLNNLEWSTISENNKHALNNGLRTLPNGVNHYNSRFDEKNIIEIRNSDLSESKLALIYNVNRATIGKIKRNERYKNIVL